MKILDYFNQKESTCYEKEKQLQSEDRNDEAVFEKIKANVYNIFRTVLSVSIKKYPNDSSNAHDDFFNKLDQISSQWVIAYEKAEQHNDVEKMHIENIKLNVVKDIRETIPQLWEETA